MKTLIIYTHPSPTGFNAAILKEVQSNLSKKHEVKTLDLYAENFDPILRFDQEHRRRDLHKDPEMAKYRDLITWADHLIFIFPIWWSGMPAILKGFIDRVFAADFARPVRLDYHQPQHTSLCPAFCPRLWQGA